MLLPLINAFTRFDARECALVSPLTRAVRRVDERFTDGVKLWPWTRGIDPLPPDSDVGRIFRTYHAWCGVAESGGYEPFAGFCRSALLAEIETHGFVLTPGRYVGAAEAKRDGEPFEKKMRRLVNELNEQFAAANELRTRIEANLEALGYGPTEESR